MWKFKPFMPKEPTGLEGRFIDIDKLKVTVKSVIAEGGFSCVYLARDVVNASKQYALKHIICNDEESLDLVKKEISVMKSLKGHPNVVTLYGHSMMDMGRVKEAFLVMEFCEKSLVNVLESRGAAYFEEKQVLTIFRDVCNAVFAMHCQSPPIAHRDLKVENVLLGSDGLWKLCDFGSTSTNHKVFEKPEEMGIEEDNIRKHTTPAYRAPEMWDLFRRDVINEKVDIWALGCLLYRICYFKLAFDGDSKLQVLNGNYRIPDVPKYSSFVTDLIRDMLQSSPDSRPDITQVWFRVNEQLPVPLQKSLPDRPPELRELGAATNEGILKPANRSPMPSRSPPPPPSSSELTRNTPSSHAARNAPGGAGLGAFWSTKHAKDSVVSENTSAPKFDEETTNYDTSKPDRNRLDKHHSPGKACPPKKEERTAPGISQHLDRGNGKSKEMKSDNIGTFGDETFNEFVADFDTSKIRGDKPGKDESLEAEIQRLREQLKRANMEKTEITSKYEKLSAICRSQRQEIQELKQALASKTPCPNKDASKYQPSSVNPSSADAQKGESTLWETSSESKPWQAFADEPSPHTSSRSIRTRNGRRNSQDMSADNGWAFGTDTFNAATAAASQISRSSGQGGKSQRFGDPDSSGSKSAASQPSGWAAF